MPLDAAPPDLRHLATVRGGISAAAPGAERSRVRRRGLAHPSARSLLFTVLGEYVLPSPSPAWSSALIAALRTLDVDEKAARQAIARTAAAGWLTGHRSGRRVAWGLTTAGRDLLEHGAERIYGFGLAQPAWDGRWLLLRVNVPEERRELRHKLRTQLAWAGFGPLRQGLWLSPHVGREVEAARILENLGLHGEAASFVVRPGAIGDQAAMVREAWDLDSLGEEYRGFVRTFGSSRRLSPDETFAALTRMVHEWRRFPFLDPGLPATLLPPGWPGHQAHDLFAERRAAWGPTATAWFAEQGR